MGRALKNIPLKTFRKFLEESGCKQIRNSGGHEVWSHSNASRPITIQSHIDPIPTFIVVNNLKTLGKTRKDFLEWLEK